LVQPNDPTILLGLEDASLRCSSCFTRSTEGNPLQVRFCMWKSGNWNVSCCFAPKKA
jgi:hypothetical protein